MNRMPAILGGAPLFESRVNMVRPVLPEFSQLDESIQEILQSGMVTKGKYLEKFEAAVAEHLGVKHAVAVSSCTSGLMLVYKGLGLSGDVVVPSFTFMATVSALEWCGLRPIFADVSLSTTNLDPAAAEAAITPATSAIVAVHNFGDPADIEGLQAVASQHHLKLIFDAAHGFGARYAGAPVGMQGDAQVFSLSPTKLLIAGEGGIVATNNDDLAQRIRIGREYGNNGRYDSAFAGLNARMPEFNALMGLHSLKNLEQAAETRNETAALYQESLARLPGIGFQVVRPNDRCSYKDYSITIDAPVFGLARDELVLALTAEGIDTRNYYDPPVHRQTAYRRMEAGQPLPNTDWLSANSVSLPIWSQMDPDVPLRISEAVQQIYAHAGAIHVQIDQKSLSKSRA